MKPGDTTRPRTSTSVRPRSGALDIAAMRFPRILRIRTDKVVEEIDTVERVEEVYQSQVDKPTEREDVSDATLS